MLSTLFVGLSTTIMAVKTSPRDTFIRHPDGDNASTEAPRSGNSKLWQADIQKPTVIPAGKI